MVFRKGAALIGLQKEAEILDPLLPEGVIATATYQDGSTDTVVYSDASEIELPMVVLVNDMTASAAELFTQSLRDFKDAKVIGIQTYGKGVVQTMFSLRDGSAIKVTVADYYTRGGNNINKVGIEPDVECELDADLYLNEGIDSQLEKAKEILCEALGN